MRRTLVRSLALAATVVGFSACSDAGQIAGPARATDISFARGGNAPSDSRSASQAQLLVCPSTESYTASATIGRDGGSLTAGGMTISLPAKAVNRPTLFTMTVPASQYVEVEIVAESDAHFNFDKRVSITMDYSRCNDDLSERPLSAWHIDTKSKALLKQMHGRTDRRDARVTFGTDHLSGYALAW